MLIVQRDAISELQPFTMVGNDLNFLDRGTELVSTLGCFSVSAERHQRHAMKRAIEAVIAGYIGTLHSGKGTYRFDR